MNKCRNCGNDLKRNKYFCCHSCQREYYKKKNKRICPVCGRAFSCPPSSHQITCGNRTCENIYRGNKMETLRKSEGKRRENWENSVKCGKKETNITAKTWEIVDPSGKHYVVSNLALWARENSEILPGTVEQFCGGIRDIKRTLEGKKKRGSYQYKGWRLCNYYDYNLAAGETPKIHSKTRKRIPEEEKRIKKNERAKTEYYKKN